MIALVNTCTHGHRLRLYALMLRGERRPSHRALCQMGPGLLYVLPLTLWSVWPCLCADFLTCQKGGSSLPSSCTQVCSNTAVPALRLKA